MSFDYEYLNLPRTDGIVILQIMLNEGRAVELKKSFYKQLAERLYQELEIRKGGCFYQPRRGEKGELVIRKRGCSIC